jgi:iron complex transport system substrate-binding protein
VPELIEAAGGRPLFARAGEHSPWLDWDDLIAADPDLIVAMPCGYQLPQTLANLETLVDHSGWNDLNAVRKRKVFAVDGHHYFNRPGPRLVESAELIAQLLGTNQVRAFEMGQDWIVIGGD